MTDITRGEFDLLKEMVARDATRMESIDVHGTRGVAVIQEQVTELIKDVTALKLEASAWQKMHDAEHKADKRDRVSGRRWLIGIGFAGLATMAGVFGLLIQILGQQH